MRIRTISSAALAAGLLAATVAVPASAQASAGKDPGNRSLAAVLTSDGNRFDHRPGDYDVLTEAVLAVLDAKPDSAVGVLTDGDVALTAFIPNDASFRILAKNVTGDWIWSEKKVFNTLVAEVGVDAIEQVLLYHVVPGATITSEQALESDGAALTTAQGASFTVDVLYKRLPVVQLRDQDPNDVDPFLNPRALDINRGNLQIAHGIFLVLRPLDLP